MENWTQRNLIKLTLPCENVGWLKSSHVGIFLAVLSESDPLNQKRASAKFQPDQKILTHADK